MTMMMPAMHVGRGAQMGPLSMFPVWTDASAPAGLVTGRAAHVDVAERADAPTVSELVVRNVGDRVALLLEGELLEGGWQQRALVHDLLLAPGAPMTISVACVEHGRWAGSSRSSDTPAARRPLCGPPCRRLRPGCNRTSGSGSGDTTPSLGGSPTQSYVDHLNQPEPSR